MNQEALEAPFPPGLVRQRPGSNGMTLEYIEIQDVIARLNAALGGSWSFEVTRKEVVEDEIVVFGRMRIGDAVHEDVGGTSITRRRDDDLPVSIVDDTKAAVSDCIKRCARQAGVGLHLGRAADDAAPNTAERRPVAAATPAQLAKLRSLAAQQGIALTRMVGERFGCDLEAMRRSDASTLIDELLSTKSQTTRTNGQSVRHA